MEAQSTLQTAQHFVEDPSRRCRPHAAKTVVTKATSAAGGVEAADGLAKTIMPRPPTAGTGAAHGVRDDLSSSSTAEYPGASECIGADAFVIGLMDSASSFPAECPEASRTAPSPRTAGVLTGALAREGGGGGGGGGTGTEVRRRAVEQDLRKEVAPRTRSRSLCSATDTRCLSRS